MNLNTVQLYGYLTRKPALERSAGGSGYTRFTIGINSKRRVSAGDAQYPNRTVVKDEVNFIPCVAFGKTAENISTYLDKGSAVLVTGRITNEPYDDRGEPRNRISVIATDIQFGPKRDTAPKDAPQTVTVRQAA